MKKQLTIVFKDGSKVTYTIRRKNVDWEPYFERHSKSSMESAILQIYPKKDNEPIVLVSVNNL